MIERMQLDLRETIEGYLSFGWEMISRNPITLERGNTVLVVRNGIVITQTKEKED